MSRGHKRCDTHQLCYRFCYSRLYTRCNEVKTFNCIKDYTQQFYEIKDRKQLLKHFIELNY